MKRVTRNAFVVAGVSAASLCALAYSKARDEGLRPPPTYTEHCIDHVPYLVWVSHIGGNDFVSGVTVKYAAGGAVGVCP